MRSTLTAVRIALTTLAASLAAGCYCSHTRTPADAGPDAREDDAGLDAGAVPERDAGPTDDRYWAAVDPAGVELALERCEVREGQSLIVRVTVTTSGCDEPGNARLVVDHALREVRVETFVWRPMNVPPCPPFTREIVRDVALDPTTSLAQGDWRLTAVDGTSVTFFVQSGPPELTCTDCIAPGTSCEIDMECEGARACVALRGDAICASQCEAPCQPLDETGGSGDLSCRERLGVAASCEEDPNLGWICVPAAIDLCPPCPDGQACRAGADALAYCEWSISAFDAGATCAGDRDCDRGFSCVELFGARTCQVRCRGDHPCPSSESCAYGATVCPIPKI